MIAVCVFLATHTRQELDKRDNTKIRKGGILEIYSKDSHCVTSRPNHVEQKNHNDCNAGQQGR